MKSLEARDANLEPLPRKRGFVGLVLRGRPTAVIGLCIMLFFLALSLASPLIAPYSTTQQTCSVYAPPSLHHLLGCDDGGIDMLSLLLNGGRISLLVGSAATLVAMVIGGSVGIISGYFGGWIDTLLMRVTDYFLVLPDLVLMIVIAAIWGPSLFHVILVIGILLWTSTARVIRAQTKSVRERLYVSRARSLGQAPFKVLLRHVLPQVAPLLIANTVLTVALAIFDETSLDFLGLGNPTSVSWGIILEHANDRTAVSFGAWWAFVPAGICIALVIMGCYLFGQAIEDALNPRLKVAHLSIRHWRLRPLVGFDREAL